MLVLIRKSGQEIVIGGGISVKVLSITGGRIQLGVVAPRKIVVNRAEVETRRARSNPSNSQSNEKINTDAALKGDADVA